MQLNSAAIVFFSPTGTTKKILLAINQGLQIANPRIIDFTSVAARQTSLDRFEEDLVIIGVPVYEERIPEVVTSNLEKLRGKAQPVILVAVYGNIGYGITLQELNHLAESNGFTVIAAASYIGEHSFSTPELPIAPGRPDADDLEHAKNFGRLIKEKLNKIDDLSHIEKLTLPGHLPLMARILPKNSASLFSKDPESIKDRCNHCRLCVKHCPVSAIHSDTLQVNSNICLRCFACVKKCPKKARAIIFKKRWLVSRVLKAQSRKRRNPEIFL
ncbi:MAG TPA: EFR1 family ferrodoxin [Bacillota bacterium]|nr:EFR1 family ferrodoxin [Bacillota bacterium]